MSSNSVSRSPRLGAVDALRGLVMIIMALDHVRDFVHRAAMEFPPEDLTRTYPLLFMTRWVTHFCAPVFMFTAGMSAYLWWRRGRTRGELSRFLWTRGLWLILLEVTVMRLAYNLNFGLNYPVLLIVLWALGGCMVLMAPLVYLPLRWLAVVSVAVIALHNLMDGVKAAQFGAFSGFWNVIHEQGAVTLGGVLVVVVYPLIPWVAVMTAGFCFGQVFEFSPERRQRILLRTGAATTAAFVLLRAINIYGDPARWAVQKGAAFTILSFLNCTKYPPSLLYLLMTLGPALMVLAWFDRRRFGPGNPLIVFGRVPLFYFIVHFYLAHLAAVALAFVRYSARAAQFVWNPIPAMGGPRDLYPADFGYPLWVVYLVWACLVVGLYPVCRWFAGVKSRRKEWWLSYL